MSKWNEMPLQIFCEVITKGTTPTSVGKNFTESGINFIKAESITENGAFIKSKFAYIDAVTNNILHRSQLQKDDILFSIAGVIGRVAIVNNNILPANTNQALAIVRTKKECCIDLGYLYFYLKSDNVNRQFKRISNQLAQANFNLQDLGNVIVKYPELPIQQKIAKILSTIDGQIEKTEAIIAKYQAVKQGMQQDLFTRGIDITTGKLRPRYEDAPELYKDSPLGMIPKEWEVVRLGEITTYVDYRGKTPPKSDIGVFLVTAKNVKFGYIDYEVSREYIPTKAYDIVMSRGLPEVGDVLFTTEAPLGNVAQVDKSDIALAQRVIKFRGVNNIISNDFLTISLMADYFQRMLTMEASGSTVLGIKGSKLHKMKLFVPNATEQMSICSVLKVIQAKTNTEILILQKLLRIKQGLMSDLLSGKVEVTA